jgi:hypothetical protein
MMPNGYMHEQPRESLGYFIPRFKPNDPGYQILRKWSLNQVELQRNE